VRGSYIYTDELDRAIDLLATHRIAVADLTTVIVHCLRRWLRSTAARRRNREGPHCAGRFRYRLSTTSLNRHNKTTKENLNDRARHMALNCSVARAGIEPATFRFSGGVVAYTDVFQLATAG
jgi:hypothetical protein